jgi:hypothetical protein
MRSVGRVGSMALGGALAIALVGGIAACSPSDGASATYPVGSVGPDRTVSPAVVQTRGQIAGALGGSNLILNDTISPYRPPESAMLASAPRAVYQVTLPADPTGGYIVVYEFTDTAQAAMAAAEQQAYLATGPGRVQSPQGTVHTIRQVGTTVVYYAWQPAAATNDPGAAEIQAALETLGVGYPVS